MSSISIGAGLPDHYHKYTCRGININVTWGNGVIMLSQDSGWSGITRYTKVVRSHDASSIYGSSNTVTPLSLSSTFVIKY